MQAGAPPDAFATKGQNWGFPTYNWPRMAADGFAWWKQRFAQMGNYFDAFRIDHILGFFRIWSSPAHAVEGILGHFVPAIPVDAAEFAARGIPFDRDRFTQTVHHRRRVAGDFRRRQRNRPPRVFDGDRRRALCAETRIRHAAAGGKLFLQNGKRTSAMAKIKTGLFDLISNVILLEEEGKFHFRFAMEQTLSFKNLAADTPGQAARFVCGLFFPAAGRFLEARGDAETAGAQARDEHAHLRRRPRLCARLRAGGDEASSAC